MGRPRGKTIAYVCPSSGIFCNHHLHLATEAAKDNKVYALLARDDEDSERVLAERNITVRYISLSRKSGNPFRVWSEATALRELLQGINPDIINAINLKAVLTAAMANVDSSARFVGTIPGLGYMFTGDSLRQRALRQATVTALRYVLKRQNHILIFSNQDDAEEFIRRRVVTRENQRIIPVPGVDITVFKPTPEPEKGFRVVLPARMLWDKGIKEFVEAATLLRDKIPEAEFILAGPEDKDNPAAISAAQLNEWTKADSPVTWIGHCTDMPSLLSSSHVVCLPSRREGFPRVLVEAMACGRAIVTTDVPGCRDIGQIGHLVPYGNVSALADVLLSLYKTPGTRKHLIKCGWELVTKYYTSNQITLATLSCY